MNELASLRSENAVLKARVEELNNVVTALSFGWKLVNDWHGKIVHLICNGGTLKQVKELGIMQYPSTRQSRKQARSTPMTDKQRIKELERCLELTLEYLAGEMHDGTNFECDGCALKRRITRALGKAKP